MKITHPLFQVGTPLAILGVLAVVGSVLFAAEEVGRIAFLRGQADVVDLESGQAATARLGQAIYKTSQVRTGQNATLEILLHDQTRVRVLEVSVLNMKEVRLKQAGASTINFLTGKARVIFARRQKESPWVVKTLTAVAGARGTELGVIATKKGSRFAVFEGVVEVASLSPLVKTAFQLKAGQETHVEKNQAPAAPRPLSSYELRDWFDLYRIDELDNIIRVESGRDKKEKPLLDRVLEKKK